MSSSLSSTMWVVKAFAWIFRLIPQRGLWWLGSFLGFLWWSVFRLRRFTLYRNISIAFPELSRAERCRIIHESLAHMGLNFFEILQIPALSKAWVEKNIIIEGLENYHAANKGGKGVLYLSLHLANGDIGVIAMARRGMRAHLISKRFRNKFLNDLWWGIRGEQGAKFIDAHHAENAFQILKALKKNEGVIFVLDQFMGRPYGIPTVFFGAPTATAYGMALFAAKTRAPVLPLYTYRDQALRTHLVFGAPIDFVEEQNKDLQIAKLTQKYNDVIEAIIRQHPEQWMWVHRRWKRYE